MVCVMACFRRGNVLVGSELVDREVPVQTAGFAAVQIAGMGVGVPLGLAVLWMVMKRGVMEEARFRA